MGYGITVGHNAAAMLMLMYRAGPAGLPGNRRRRRLVIPAETAADLVDRYFARTQPDQHWVTDITEHRTREGKVYCAFALDVFSRLVVGWSIDSSPTSSLVTSALGMAIDNRRPDGTVIHSGQGTQHLMGVYPPGPPISTGPLDGLDRGLFRQCRGRIVLGEDAGSTSSTGSGGTPESSWPTPSSKYLEIFHNWQRRHSSLGMRTPIENDRIRHDNQRAALPSQESRLQRTRGTSTSPSNPGRFRGTNHTTTAATTTFDPAPQHAHSPCSHGPARETDKPRISPIHATASTAWLFAFFGFGRRASDAPSEARTETHRPESSRRCQCEACSCGLPRTSGVEAFHMCGGAGELRSPNRCPAVKPTVSIPARAASSSLPMCRR